MSGYVWQRWLLTELREAGLHVVPVEGWENRGRPATTGSFDPQGGHTVHHTGTTTSKDRPAPTLRTVIEGRPDLPGPLAHFLVGYDGTVYLIAAGRCNHAGRVGKAGVTGMPMGADGNALALGDEVDTDGTQDLPPEQRFALATVAAVVNRHKDRNEEWTHRHADISGTGKWDIGQLTTPQLRAMVKGRIASMTTTNTSLGRAKVEEGLSAIAAGLELLGRAKAPRVRVITMRTGIAAGVATIRAALKSGPAR